jgi:hypothetical protein
MVEIKIGENNDCVVYALRTARGFEPLNREDLEYCAPDYKIFCDKGVYPGISDFEQYICDKAQNELGMAISLSDVLTLTEVSEKYNIPLKTLQSRLNNPKTGLVEIDDFRKIGDKRGVILSPSGVKKILSK